MGKYKQIMGKCVDASHLISSWATHKLKPSNLIRYEHKNSGGFFCLLKHESISTIDKDEWLADLGVE